jgi:hypothetical protein
MKDSKCVYIMDKIKEGTVLKYSSPESNIKDVVLDNRNTK